MGIVHSIRSLITVFNDSQEEIKLDENERINRRNKHLNITLKYIPAVVSGREYRLE